MLSHPNRLRSIHDFALVKEKGVLIQSENIALNVFNRGDQNDSRFGIIVSTKISKSAVIRNKIRRAIREAVRLNIAKVSRGVDGVFLVRSSILKLGREDIMKEVEKVMKNAKPI